MVDAASAEPSTPCDECGFVYDLTDATDAPREIRAAVDDVITALQQAEDPPRRRQSDRWSPLEYSCHMRDVLLVQRERVLTTLWVDRPSFAPMGRDERVEHDGYADQDPSDVARQLGDAARLFTNIFERMAPEEWDRAMTYNYPVRAERSLRWIAVHTLHEVRHHLSDIRQQLN